MKTQSLILLTLALAAAGQAAPRTSADYSITAETIDTGGTHATSTHYAHHGSLGGIVGVSSVATPAATAKHGYLGQLYEITGLAVTAAPSSVDEGSSTQLAAWQLLDDASQLAVNATEVAWSVVTGPLTGITAAGLASAAIVYQDTLATVQGGHGGLDGQCDLTVLDIDPDNFGSYAGDGLEDGWQVLHFGLDNPLAAPLLDPDGDGQNNHFEFTAGLVPTDPLSRFLLRVEPVAGEPIHKRLVFSPRFEDRSYDILTSTSMQSGSWSALTGGIVSDDGEERTVTDPNATEDRKFYRVEVSNP